MKDSFGWNIGCLTVEAAPDRRTPEEIETVLRENRDAYMHEIGAPGYGHDISDSDFDES